LPAQGRVVIEHRRGKHSAARPRVAGTAKLRGRRSVVGEPVLGFSEPMAPKSECARDLRTIIGGPILERIAPRITFPRQSLENFCAHDKGAMKWACANCPIGRARALSRDDYLRSGHVPVPTFAVQV
jgi:hypothetical protein